MSTQSQSALARLAADTKTACATSADVVKAANPTASKGIAYHAKAAVLVHSFYLTAASGFIVGVAACYLANKYWLNKVDSIEQTTSE